MDRQINRPVVNRFYFKGVPKGFTIVELLVVIVVIGILATLSFVAYRGISQKANDAKAQVELSSAFKQLKLYYAENGQYPVAIDSCPNPTAGNTCIKNRASLNNYLVAVDRSGFCTSSKIGDNSFFITSTATPTPTKGDCLGTAVMASTATTDYTTPGTYSWTVPANVTLVHLESWGAQGGVGASGGGYPGGAGGAGGYGTGVLAVTPGDVLTVFVGTQGSAGSTGGESYVKKGTSYLTRGYGGYSGGDAYEDCSDWYWDDCVGYWYWAAGGTGSPGYGFADTNLLTSTSLAYGGRNGNGRVLLTYIPGETLDDYSTPQNTNWTVPSSVVSLKIEVWGAQGGSGGNYTGVTGAAGNKGGYAKGTLPVVAGDIYNIVIGSIGTTGVYNGANGGVGGESYLKKGATYIARGYGGGGGQSSYYGCTSWYDYYDDWGYPQSDCLAYGPVSGYSAGAAGTGYANTGLLTGSSIASGQRNGNGRMLITYQKAIPTPVTF